MVQLLTVALLVYRCRGSEHTSSCFAFSIIPIFARFRESQDSQTGLVSTAASAADLVEREGKEHGLIIHFARVVSMLWRYSPASITARTQTRTGLHLLLIAEVEAAILSMVCTAHSELKDVDFRDFVNEFAVDVPLELATARRRAIAANIANLWQEIEVALAHLSTNC